MDFSRLFREKYIVRRVMEARESRTSCFFMSIPTIKYYRSYLMIYIKEFCVGGSEPKTVLYCRYRTGNA